MGLVVIKLFLVDLGNSGTIERIISFIGIGVLLLVVEILCPRTSEKYASPPGGNGVNTRLRALLLASALGLGSALASDDIPEHQVYAWKFPISVKHAIRVPGCRNTDGGLSVGQRPYPSRYGCVQRCRRGGTPHGAIRHRGTAGN